MNNKPISSPHNKSIFLENGNIVYSDYLQSTPITVNVINEIIYDYYDYQPVTRLFYELYVENVLPKGGLRALNKENIIRESIPYFEWISEYFTGLFHDPGLPYIEELFVELRAYNSCSKYWNTIHEMFSYFKNYLIEFNHNNQYEYHLHTDTMIVLFPSILSVISYNPNYDHDNRIRPFDWSEAKRFYLLINWISGRDLSWVKLEHDKIVDLKYVESISQLIGRRYHLRKQTIGLTDTIREYQEIEQIDLEIARNTL